MPCDSHVEDHLKHARQALHEAHHAVGGHLRTAARHVLHAGLAALDAAEARRCQRQHPPADAPAPAAPVEMPPVT